MSADQFQAAIGHTCCRAVVPSQSPLALVPPRLFLCVRVTAAPRDGGVTKLRNIRRAPETNIAIRTAAQDKGRAFCSRIETLIRRQYIFGEREMIHLRDKLSLSGTPWIAGGNAFTDLPKTMSQQLNGVFNLGGFQYIRWRCTCG